MNLKDLSEELSSYISDAEKLELVREAFRRLEQTTPSHRTAIRGGDDMPINVGEYFRFRELLLDDE